MTTLRWTTTKPTKPGNYWRRSGGPEYPGTVVYIHRPEEAGDKWEWAGPIDLPLERDERGEASAKTLRDVANNIICSQRYAFDTLAVDDNEVRQITAGQLRALRAAMTSEPDAPETGP